jgi:hypothetical protein
LSLPSFTLASFFLSYSYFISLFTPSPPQHQTFIQHRNQLSYLIHQPHSLYTALLKALIFLLYPRAQAPNIVMHCFSTTALLLVLAGALWPASRPVGLIATVIAKPDSDILSQDHQYNPVLFRVPGSSNSVNQLASALDRIKKSSSSGGIVRSRSMSMANPLMETLEAVGTVGTPFRRPEDCPPCFNCLLDAFPCSHFAPCNAYDGRCTCPPGFAGDNCSIPGKQVKK